MFEIHVCENKTIGLSIVKCNEVLLTTLTKADELFNEFRKINKL